MSERVARAALSRLSEPGDVRLAGLVGSLGAERVYELLREEQDIAGVYSDVAARLRGLDPEAELARAGAQGIRFVCPGDREWPTALDDLDAAEPLQRQGGRPLGLWVKGAVRLDEICSRVVAVVGSRSATTYGAGVAADIASGVGEQGFAVVSGAAFGIDNAAHRGALAAKGATVAILACGVDRAYPAAHRELLDYITEVGVVVSELPPGCAPTRYRFLARNRLIAAVASGTVVVEAAVRSGALNTANWTTRLHRVLMGVPGPVTSAPSAGVHELIRGRDAMLVTNATDVLELLAPVGSLMAAEPREPERPRDRLSEQDIRVLDAVPVHQAASAGSISRAAGLGEPHVTGALRRLASAGFVEADGSRWRLAATSADLR